MSLHDVADDTTVLDDADTAAVLADEFLADELLADELAGIVELAAAFLGSIQGLASDFAAFTCGTYRLDELTADLWNLGTWIRGTA